MPAAIVLGTSTFTMSALPGTPAIQNAIPMPFFGTTPFAAPGLGDRRRHHAGLWPVVARRAEALARGAGEGFGDDANQRRGHGRRQIRMVRERATTAQCVRPGGDPSRPSAPTPPPIVLAAFHWSWSSPSTF